MLPPRRSSKRLCGEQIGKQDSVGKESEDDVFANSKDGKRVGYLQF